MRILLVLMIIAIQGLSQIAVCGGSNSEPSNSAEIKPCCKQGCTIVPTPKDAEAGWFSDGGLLMNRMLTDL